MSHHGCPERLSNRSKGFQEDGSSQPTMEVLVETLTGTAFEMTVSPTDTIFTIKSKIFRVEGIPVAQQHLLYNLKELDDASSLRDHHITDGARLRLVLGMRGGPISTRRLPPPPSAEPWRDIERLLDSHRDDADWASGSSGCKVTVIVFRDNERVNMLRLRENKDGSYSPLKYSSSLGHLLETEPESCATGSLQDNALTMSKMMELRRRMHSLCVQRRGNDTDKPEIQKTRSEETLSVPSLLDDTTLEPFKHYTAYSEAEDTFTPLYDGNYTRYDYDCSFNDRYTLLPPIGARTDSDPTVQDAGTDGERIKLSDALAGSILVKNGLRDGKDEASILEECLDGVEECQIRQESSHTTKNLTPIPATEYAGGLVTGGRWSSPGRAGSSLSRGLFSSSTSELDTLKRNTRILPALSRHRNREHLHLSDEGLDLTPPLASSSPSPPRNLEVGSERRQRRIEKIAEMETTRLYQKKNEEKHEVKETKVRIRCGFCKKRLSIATVHKCRCGAEFCAPHRYAEVHGCAYDYKANAHQYLQRANPLVSAPKLPKI